MEVVRSEGDELRLERDLWERPVERGLEPLRPSRRGTVGVHTVLPEERMVESGLGQHRSRKSFGVVRTEEPPAGACQREVQERLVPLALHELGGRAFGPDRLSDPAERTSGRFAVLYE